jgi:hypothetical protein
MHAFVYFVYVIIRQQFKMFAFVYFAYVIIRQQFKCMLSSTLFML